MHKNDGSNGDIVTDLSLPIHAAMITVEDKEKISILHDQDNDGRPTMARTAYTVLDLGLEERTDNVSPVYHTRPAINCIFLKRDPETGLIYFGLVQRERPDRGVGRPAGLVTKACGGYCHDGSTGNLQSFVEMIHGYVGLKVRVEDLYLCGNEKHGYVSDLGHRGILTPIAFTYATKWEDDLLASPKMKLVWIPWGDVNRMCFDTMNNVVDGFDRIEDTSSILSIINAGLLISTEQILIGNC